MSRAACDVTASCITCGDEGIEMQVVELQAGAATCLDEQGERHEVAVDLIDPVVPGDHVLVHAGVAIA